MKLISRAVIRLITISYDAQSDARQAELQECLHRNLANPHLGQVLVWKQSGKTPIAQPGLESKLALLERNHSPTFDELFALANAVCDRDDVAVIANSDVWFDDTAALIESIRPEQCFALLRWEEDGKMYSAHDGGPRPDSQDAWIFRTPIRPVGAPFGLGQPRNDNALAYRLSKLGFDLRNPAKSIRIHHRHASAVRSYASTKFRIPPPWLHLEATEIHERGATKLTRKTFSLKWQLHRLRAGLRQTGRRLTGVTAPPAAA